MKECKNLLNFICYQSNIFQFSFLFLIFSNQQLQLPDNIFRNSIVILNYSKIYIFGPKFNITLHKLVFCITEKKIAVERNLLQVVASVKQKPKIFQNVLSF